MKKVTIFIMLSIFYVNHGFAQQFTKITEGVVVNDSSSSCGCSWADYDNDDDLDLFVVNFGENNCLYENNGDGTFTQIKEGVIVNDGGYSSSCTWGDFDNDGNLDLFVTNKNSEQVNFFYKNEGESIFTRIAEGTITEDVGKSTGCSWVDFDNDGYLDLFVANKGTNDFLYRNNKNGTFNRITKNDITDDEHKSLSCCWGDYDNDGKLDLFVVTNDSKETNLLFHNEGNGDFMQITEGDIVNDGGYSVGCCWGDFNNDGFLDLFVANFGAFQGDPEDNFLYQNNGDGTFTKITTGDVVNDGSNSNGGNWGDYDNDGDLDLVVINNGFNFLYENNGEGKLTQITTEDIVTDFNNSSYGIWGDYDNDGDLDLFIASSNYQNNSLYVNNGNSNSWLNIKCIGTYSNTSAIGTKVWAKAIINETEVWQMREISAQSGGRCQNSLNIEFGFGNATVVDTIKVEWPSGIVQYLTALNVNYFLTITEENDLPPEIIVTYPSNADIIWETGVEQTISWTSSYNAGKSVKIELYKEGVLNRILTDSTKNDGSFEWPVPAFAQSGTDYKIKISTVSDSSVFDFSNHFFEIQQNPQVIVTYPNSTGIIWETGKEYTITWNSWGNVGPYLLIELYKNDEFDRAINYSADNNGSYTWSVPEDQAPDSNYTIIISSASQVTIYDFCDNPFTIISGSSVEPNGLMDITNHLFPNYPNPFNPTTTIRYEISKTAIVQMKIFNIRGELVRILENARKTRGVYQVQWDGKDSYNNLVSSGIFFIEMKADGFSQRRKITLLR